MASHGKRTLNSLNGIIIHLVLFKMKMRRKCPFIYTSIAATYSASRIKVVRVDQMSNRNCSVGVMAVAALTELCMMFHASYILCVFFNLQNN